MMSNLQLAISITAGAIGVWLILVGIVDVVWRAEIREVLRQLDEIKKARKP